MQKKTFVDNMESRGYGIRTTVTGNIVATNGDTTIEWLRTDHERIYVATPKAKALIDPKIADAEALQLMDYLARP